MFLGFGKIERGEKQSVFLTSCLLSFAKLALSPNIATCRDEAEPNGSIFYQYMISQEWPKFGKGYFY